MAHSHAIVTSMKQIDYFYYFYYEATKESGSRRVDETESHDRYIVRSGRKIHLTLFVTAWTAAISKAALLSMQCMYIDFYITL